LKFSVQLMCPGIAHVLVVLRVTGQREHVVAADRVAHDLDERVHVDVVELAVEPRAGHCGAHQRAGGDPVEPPLEPVLQLVLIEGEEVRALLPLDVDDLDVLPRHDLVGECRGLVDAEVEPRFGERRRQLDLELRPRTCPLHLDDQRRGGRLAVHDPAAGRAHHEQDVAVALERL